MISTLLNHKIRKDLIRQNKKHNHRQYFRALQSGPRLKYWAGYHKKKLIFFGIVAIISWTYDLHTSMLHSLMSLRSPRQLFSHLLFGSEKVQNTINEQRIVGWQFGDPTLQLLTKLYYETDQGLIFGVGRNYLFQVYSNMGLLQKPQDVNNFWVAGGFHRKRNQIISGVGYKQFITLYGEGYKSLKKIEPQLSQEDYLKKFLTLFISKASGIVQWEKEYNKIRFNEYLKNLLTDNDNKSDEICELMKQNLQISIDEVDRRIEEMGMKGLGIRDKWLYWKNRQVLMCLREYNLQKRLNLNIVEGRQRMQLDNKLKQIEKELNGIAKEKELLKANHRAIYEEELI